MQPFTAFSSRVVSLPVDNIDTDQIIPARYLKTTSRTGLGVHLFEDWRYDTTGDARPGFPLNHPHAQGAQILLAGDNFGCGSSREHAPWALTDFGFRAVISTSFADIFRNNALKNGLLPIVVDPATHQQLLSLVEEEPATQLRIDLAGQTVRLPDGRNASFTVDPFSKACLLEGVDELGYLLKHESQISDYEAAHPTRVNTAIA